MTRRLEVQSAWTGGPSSAPRARIFTTFGTVLYVDPPSGQLRHGAIVDSPSNAVLLADQRSQGSRWRGWLVYEQDSALVPIVYSPDHCQASAHTDGNDGATATPTSLELLP